MSRVPIEVVQVVYIWPGKMNLGKILFLISRYTTFLDSIVYALGKIPSLLALHGRRSLILLSGNGQLFGLSLSKQVNRQVMVS